MQNLKMWEEAKESVAEEFEELGNIYVHDRVPERNGKVRLIRQVLGDSALQLFFLLPDGEDHSVEIQSSDSLGELALVESVCRNQFRFYAFQKSPESHMKIKIYIDGVLSYEKRFLMPAYLRSPKKAEYVDRTIESDNSSTNESEISLLETPEETVKSFDVIDINFEVSSHDISKEAIRLLKGE